VPELPDVEVYVEALARRFGGRPLLRVRLASPFVVRTVEPPLADAEGRVVAGFRRLGPSGSSSPSRGASSSRST
jgi:formamidopyrimidine-DNA glycosylase